MSLDVREEDSNDNVAQFIISRYERWRGKRECENIILILWLYFISSSVVYKYPIFPFYQLIQSHSLNSYLRRNRL